MKKISGVILTALLANAPTYVTANGPQAALNTCISSVTEFLKENRTLCIGGCALLATPLVIGTIRRYAPSGTTHLWGPPSSIRHKFLPESIQSRDPKVIRAFVVDVILTYQNGDKEHRQIFAQNFDELVKKIITERVQWSTAPLRSLELIPTLKVAWDNEAHTMFHGQQITLRSIAHSFSWISELFNRKEKFLDELERAVVTSFMKRGESHHFLQNGHLIKVTIQ